MRNSLRDYRKDTSVKVINLLLGLLALGTSTATDIFSQPPIPPSINLSAIRYIYCPEPDGWVSGTGFLIADGVMATADHVAREMKDHICYDQTDGVRIPLKPYKEDPQHDFALVSGNLPTDMPYVKYSCQKFVKGNQYHSYGITSYGMEYPIARMNTIRFTGGYVDNTDAVEDFPNSKGMGLFDTPIAPGMSGGPVLNEQDYAVAVNNAGNEKDTLLFQLADTALCTGKW